MTKDFLFLRYAKTQCWEWVPMYDYVASKGHSCDFVDETNIQNFVPSCNYRCVVLNLHGATGPFPHVNRVLGQLGNKYFFVYMDDTDYNECTDGRSWSDKKPNLIFQRETLEDTPNPHGCKRYPIHFPIASMYDEALQEKKYDVCFLGNNTNPRRIPFINKLKELATGRLKHLKWYLSYSPTTGTITEDFKKIINQSKIGMNYPGNSYDQWRNWQLASTKTAMIMPKVPLLSITADYLPFDELNYTTMRYDMEDMEDKILYLLENERYKEQAERAWIDYNANHTPQKVSEYFYSNLIKEMNNYYAAIK